MGIIEKGDRLVYFPPDIQLPRYVANMLGVSNYLRKGTVVKTVKLRGQYSYGMAFPLNYYGFEVLKEFSDNFDSPSGAVEGKDVSEYFGARRYVVAPNFNVGQGRQVSEHPSLTRYTDIDRLERNHQLFQAGEQVSVTEKIHGANVRIAMIDGELMIGSRKTQRGLPETLGDLTKLNDMEWTPFDDNMYWIPLNFAGVRKFLTDFKDSYKQIIIFGEVFGKGVQGSFDYGREGLDFVAFDIMFNGVYQNPSSFAHLTNLYSIPIAPVEYVGEFVPEIIQYHIGKPSNLTSKHIREGVVVKPLNERYDPRHGRVIAKLINPEYLVKKSEEKVEDNQEQ